jgi:hypothetical protein
MRYFLTISQFEGIIDPGLFDLTPHTSHGLVSSIEDTIWKKMAYLAKLFYSSRTINEKIRTIDNMSPLSSEERRKRRYRIRTTARTLSAASTPTSPQKHTHREQHPHYVRFPF